MKLLQTLPLARSDSFGPVEPTARTPSTVACSLDWDLASGDSPSNYGLRVYVISSRLLSLRSWRLYFFYTTTIVHFALAQRHPPPGLLQNLSLHSLGQAPSPWFYNYLQGNREAVVKVSRILNFSLSFFLTKPPCSVSIVTSSGTLTILCCGVKMPELPRSAFKVQLAWANASFNQHHFSS